MDPLVRRSLWMLALLPLSAWAGSVYLNNVNIDGVTNQKFDHATVRIDDKGNVFIDAPGYAAKVVQAPPASPAPPIPTPTSATLPAAQAPAPAPAYTPPASNEPARLTQRYWLVTEQSSPGMTDYDVDVYVNAKWIRKLASADGQIITEITRFLTPGKNTVLLAAHKLTDTPRHSYSPEHVFKVIIGTGNVGGDNVMIDQALIQFQRTAAEDKDISQEYSFTTR